jgi:hypothetical protein
MTQKNYTQIKQKGFWRDETGIKIPVNRITKAEKLAERKAEQIVKKAVDLNKRLATFKHYLKEAAQEVFEAFVKENGGKVKPDHKGNFTFYSFNRGVKIEVNISEPIDFDDITIGLAQEKLQEFLEKNINADNAFIKEMVIDAFKTRRGKLDAKRVLDLTRYKDKVNKPLFTEAVGLINKAIRRKPTKTYYKVFLKDDEGQYKNIELNFSNVKPQEK